MAVGGAGGGGKGGGKGKDKTFPASRGGHRETEKMEREKERREAMKPIDAEIEDTDKTLSVEIYK